MKCITSLLLVFFPMILLAQWDGTSSKYVLVGKPPIHGLINIPSTTTDGAGGIISLWIGGQDVENPFLFAERVNALGELQWNPVDKSGIVVASDVARSSHWMITEDRTGGAFIVWKNKNLNWVVQRIDQNGDALWGLGVELGEVTIDMIFFEPDGMGGVCLSWFGATGYAQYVNNTGTKMWGENGNPAEILGNMTLSIPGGICFDENGDLLISYTYAGTSDSDVGIQKITKAGLKPWGNDGKPVVNFTSHQFTGIPVTNSKNGNIIPDGMGGAIVAWLDYRNDPENGQGEYMYPEIFVQRINTSGEILWDLAGVKASNPVKLEFSTQPEINIYPDNANGAVLLWDDKLNGIVYTQRVNNLGSPLYPENKIVTSGMALDNNSNRDSFFRAAKSANGSYLLIAWVKELSEKFVFRADKIDINTGSSVMASNGSGVRVADEFEDSEKAGTVPYNFSVEDNGQSGIIITWLGGISYPENTDGYVYSNMLHLNAILPIELSHFVIVNSNGFPLLKWTTVLESNSSYFGIERSVDGTNFSEVGRVNATGNSSKSIDYSYLDKDIDLSSNQIFFYRLRQADRDGAFDYSKTIQFKIPTISHLRLTENPVRDKATIVLSSQKATSYNLQLTDINGKVVVRNFGQLAKGLNHLTVPMTYLAKGVFVLNLTVDNTNIIFKVLKE